MLKLESFASFFLTSWWPVEQFLFYSINFHPLLLFTVKRWTKKFFVNVFFSLCAFQSSLAFMKNMSDIDDYDSTKRSKNPGVVCNFWANLENYCVRVFYASSCKVIHALRTNVFLWKDIPLFVKITQAFEWGNNATPHESCSTFIFLSKLSKAEERRRKRSFLN